MHSKHLQAFDFNRMQVFPDPYLLHSTDSSAMEGKLAKLWSHFLKRMRYTEAEKVFFSRKLFSNFELS